MSHDGESAAVSRATSARRALVAASHIERAILELRGQQVLLDQDLAALYEIETRQLVQAVRRNADRFPADFMFQLTAEEFATLKGPPAPSGHGGRRHRPYAFTEQGVAMLSSVLRSRRAVEVNIQIMRTFVHLRRLIGSNAELARKLDLLEKRSDVQFREVFNAIRRLMAPSGTRPRRIGFERPPPKG